MRTPPALVRMAARTAALSSSALAASAGGSSARANTALAVNGNPVTPDQFAELVASKVTPVAGGVDYNAVKEAVKAALREGVG